MPATKNQNKAIEKSRMQTIEVNTPARTGNVYAPCVDLFDTGPEYVLTADVPGAARDSIDVAYERQLLTLSAFLKPRTTDHSFFTQEYGVGNFKRSFRVGEDFNPDAIQASYADGVLTVRLPKRQEAMPRKIQIAS